MSRLTRVRLLTVLAAGMLVLEGCASGGLRLGLGAQSFRRAPYYAGRVAASGSIAWLPITYQRGGSQPPSWDPRGGPAMDALLAEMNAYLDSLIPGARLTIPSPAPGTPPDVRFACAMDVAGDCLSEGDEPSTPAEEARSMTLSVERATAAFTDWFATALAGTGSSHAVLITLELAPFWPRQTGLRGNKVVDLGTGYSQELPWLTALDDPIWAVELTGALLDSTGRAVRIGAEGLFARRTRFAIGAIGGQEMVTEEDIAELRTLRRADLPAGPLAWQVSLGELVKGLAPSS
jgi:hypothetical protein